jgi:hypothetical protein
MARLLKIEGNIAINQFWPVGIKSRAAARCAVSSRLHARAVEGRRSVAERGFETPGQDRGDKARGRRRASVRGPSVDVSGRVLAH